MNIYKIKYTWYEGEYGETLIAKDVERKEFEEDLKEARLFAETLLGKKVEGYSDYLGKGYCVECLPEYYEQVIWYLTEMKQYKNCHYDKSVEYYVDDCQYEIKPKHTITLHKHTEETKMEDI